MHDHVIWPGERERWQAALLACERWIAEHARSADPLRWSTAAEASFRRKCFAELALNLVLAEAMGWRATTEPAAPLACIRAYVLQNTDSRLIDLAQRSPDRASLLALPLAYACSAGRLMPADVERVRALLASPVTWGFERLPFRYLDLAVACRLAGVPPRLPVDAILAVSGLMVPPDPAVAHRDAFYGITHAVFYATLLGERQVLRSDLLARSVQGGILRCIAAADHDLGLELIVAACLSGIRGGAAMRTLLGCVADEILRQGSVDIAPSRLATAFSISNPDEGIWASRIHTMEVAALALRAALFTPDAHDDDNRTDSEEVDALLGPALLALSRYDLAFAADALERLKSRGVGTDRRAIIAAATSFVDSCRRSDGSFGYLVDEARGFELAFPDESFDRQVQQPIDRACRQLLAGRGYLTNPYSKRRGTVGCETDDHGSA